MARITQVGAEARARLVRAAARAGYQVREPYRRAIQGLSGDQVIEIAPDEGENLRQIRMRVARAAKKVGTEVRSGETHEDTLLVWLAGPTGRRRRGRTPEVPVL